MNNIDGTYTDNPCKLCEEGGIIKAQHYDSLVYFCDDCFMATDIEGNAKEYDPLEESHTLKAVITELVLQVNHFEHEIAELENKYGDTEHNRLRKKFADFLLDNSEEYDLYGFNHNKLADKFIEVINDEAKDKNFISKKEDK